MVVNRGEEEEEKLYQSRIHPLPPSTVSTVSIFIIVHLDQCNRLLSGPWVPPLTS